MNRLSLLITATSGLLVCAWPLTRREEAKESSWFAVGLQYMDQPLFRDKMQFDVTTVLLLLGEATIWKTIWTRFRFRRCHWKQWIFAIAPGWAPLAGSIFAAMQSSRGPANLIFDKPPSETMNSRLAMTNLNSGASHAASNVILQNVWQAWSHGPRSKNRKDQQSGKDSPKRFREVGVVDVNISKMQTTPSTWTLSLQASCLLGQLVLALVLGLFGISFEVLVVFAMTLVGQGLLLVAVTPRPAAWHHRDFTVHKVPPLMFHMGMDSNSILFVRSATLDGQTFSLEEYCWESQSLRNTTDGLKLLVAGLSFCVFAFQLVLVGWMSSPSRLLLLILGFLGLLANAIEGAFEPDWESAYRISCTGEAFCEPEGSTLMSAVGVLLAGRFSAAETVSKLLYPDNDRFTESRAALLNIFDAEMCANCRARFRSPEAAKCLEVNGETCARKLAGAVDRTASKQQKDGVATVCHYLRSGTPDENLPKIDTKVPFQQYSWEKGV